MQALPETFVANRLGGSRHFLRQLLPAWNHATEETTSRDRAFAEAPDQESDSHLRLRASKSEGWGQPSPDHLRGPRRNDEAPFLDHPEPGRSWQPPRRHPGLLGPLPRRVLHFLLARWCAALPDKH